MSVPKNQRAIFDHIESVTTRKNLSYFESLDEEEKKTYSPFLINRMIGADFRFIRDCDMVSRNMNILDTKHVRKLMHYAYPNRRPDLKKTLK